MKRKMLISMITILMGIFCLTGFTFSAEKKTEGPEITNEVVVLKSFEKPMPGILESKPGTTVIWTNSSRTPQEILFIDKKAVSACSSPVNFFVGKGETYESNEIPFGGTASLCFMEKDIYIYRVKPSTTFYPNDEVDEHHGIIIIK